MPLMRRIISNRRSLTLTAMGLLVLSACSGPTSESGGAGAADGGGRDAAASTRTEVAALTPRIVLAHEGGVTTLDSADGSVLDTSELEGYVRLNPAGDGRHVVLSAADTFTLYDTGLESVGHGDHFHHYQSDPVLTGLALEAPHPGHVVPHEGRTALFADGTGAITIIDPAQLGEGSLEVLEETAADDPHHGVAVPLSDGGLLLTQGTADARDTVQVLDADGALVAETDDCPGVHGEAAAQPTESGDVVTLGCENGTVIYRDSAFHKVAVDGDYQRSGNQAGHPDSPIVLADHKVDPGPEGGIERPTEIALIDTREATMLTVDLGAEYWFRSLDRGRDGEALVLTGDGELNILDPESGEILHEVPATGEWAEPDNWQEPGPMLSVADGTAFVVDPEAQTLAMVDVASGEIYRELDLPVVPHEIQVVTGTASGEYEIAPAGGAFEGASDAGAPGEGGASDGSGPSDRGGAEHEGHDHGH